MSKIAQNIVLLALIVSISKISCQPVKPRLDLKSDTLQFLGLDWIESEEQSLENDTK